MTDHAKKDGVNANTAMNDEEWEDVLTKPGLRGTFNSLFCPSCGCLL